jgi:hypothetical protein
MELAVEPTFGSPELVLMVETFIGQKAVLRVHSRYQPLVTVFKQLH